MKFEIEGAVKPTETPIEFKLEIDGDGDVVLSAKKDGEEERLLYIDSDKGHVHFFKGVVSELGLPANKDGELIVSK